MMFRTAIVGEVRLPSQYRKTPDNAARGFMEGTGVSVEAPS
jgi:hypothetical protein